jgi:hypothetical protein
VLTALAAVSVDWRGLVTPACRPQNRTEEAADKADQKGRADLYLDKHWQLMGALEALNGMMLFGLTTAGLFSVLQN